MILSDSEHLDISTVTATNHAPTPANLEDSAHTNALTIEGTFNLEEIEQRTVRAALKHYQGNVSNAAKALGLTRGAMYRRLEKYDL